jgi:hypothetical protein
VPGYFDFIGKVVDLFGEAFFFGVVPAAVLFNGAFDYFFEQAAYFFSWGVSSNF